MAQEAAYILNIKGSTSTIESLNNVKRLIADNVREISNLKKEAVGAEKEMKKLSQTNAILAQETVKYKVELDKVEARMKELVRTNRAASKEYKELKDRKQQLIQKFQESANALQKNTAEVKRNHETVTRNHQAINILTAEQLGLKNSSTQLSRQIRDQIKAFEATIPPITSQLGLIPALEQRWSFLRKTIRGLKEDELNSPYGKKLIAEANQVKTRLDTLNRSFGDYKSTIGDYDGALNRAGRGLVSFGKQAIGALGIGSALFLGVQLLRNASTTIGDFEVGVDKLSSLTGVVGNDLKLLGDEAINISANYGTAANEILKAFTLVGSASPKLLKDIQGLTLVAENADTLAKASGDTLEDSVKAITLSLAQFNLEADQSGRIIDVLSTAAQLGATEIPDITSALEGVGNTANIVGLSLEDTVAVIEAFGAAGLKGNDVGIKFRNILISLAKSGRSEFNPALHSISDVLDALAGEVQTVEQAVGLFKRENADAALALIQHRDVVKDLTTDMSLLDATYEEGTTKLNELSNAQKQAIINTENSRGNITKLTTAWDNLILSIEKGDGVIGRFSGSIVNNLSKALDSLRTLDIPELTNGLLHLGNLPLNLLDVVTGADKNRKEKEIADRLKAAEDAAKFARDYETIIENGIPVIKKREQAEQSLFALHNKAFVGRKIILAEEIRLNDLHNQSIDALQERRLQLYAQPITKPEDNERIKNEIHELDKLIKEKMGRGGTSRKTIEDFAKGTLGYMELRLKALQDILQNSTDDAKIAKTITQINELKEAIRNLNNEIALAATEDGSIENIGLRISQLKSRLTETGDETERINLQVAIGELERKQESIQKELDTIKNATAPSLSLVQQQRFNLPSNLFALKPEDTSLFGETEAQKNKRLEEQYKEEERIRQERIKMLERMSAAEAQIQEDLNATVRQLVGDTSQAFIELFNASEEGQKDAFKNLLNQLLKFVEAQIKIVALAENTKAAVAAIGNPILLAKLALQKAIITGLISIAFGAIRTIIGSFEEGGIVKGGMRYKRPGTNDDTLIHAKQGEMVLTERNQKRIEGIAGKGIWGAGGVKGFANAPANNLITVQNSGSYSTSLNDRDINKLADVMSDRVALAVIDASRGNRIYERDKLNRKAI